MKLSEALKFYEEGKKIRHNTWEKHEFADIEGTSLTWIGLSPQHFIDNHWEVVEEPQLKKKVKLYFYTHKESLYDTKILSRVLCSTTDDYGLNEWVRLPNLDQEIEIDGE